MGRRQTAPESEAVAAFLAMVSADCEQALPAFRTSLESLGIGLSFAADATPTLDLTLATIALELQALPNLLPAPQATRVETLVHKALSSQEGGLSWWDEVSAYRGAFRKGLSHGLNPLQEVAARLMYRLTTGHLPADQVRDDTQPFAEVALMTYLARNLGRWKAITDRFQLTEG